ncbi:MAG: O-antigen ligase family protein [Gemmatimonadaceae bacterium]|nr:O-antigen ligase family protein [Gemmatimonadaceae bacterium]
MPETTSGRGALRVLQAGAIAIVLAAATYKLFELDRYFVPKELALHLTALGAIIAGVRRARRLELTRVDTLLGLYLLLGIVSAAFADNHWAAARAVGITFSGLVLFRAARATASAGSRWPLVAALAAAIVLACSTSLLQTYGITSDFFSLNRAPGGTFGNRNFIAHLAAIGAPVLLLLLVLAPRARSMLLSSTGVAILSAVLVLSRSRAAMLALIAGVIVLALGTWVAQRRFRDSRLSRRVPLAAAFAAFGAAAAILVPNTLNWKSDSPYLDTVTGVVNYREGSGHGRLVQYATSLKLAVEHPLLGVGPGNWAVAYPKVAAKGDPSIDRDGGMTANPWPSSDWVAMIAERGIPATLAFVLALVGLAVLAFGAMRNALDLDEFLASLALVATLAATLVVGSFDASLLLATPTLFVFALLGALTTPAAVRMSIPLSTATARGLAIVGGSIIVAMLLSLRSATQLASMAMFSSATTVGAYDRASIVDPGSYRIQMRIAEIGAERGRCDLVKRHAMRAHELFPSASEPAHLLAPCGVRFKRR